MSIKAGKLLAGVVLFSTMIQAARADGPFTHARLVLLQPDFVLSQRAEVPELAAYARAIQLAADAWVEAAGKAKPTSGFVVAAVRPDGSSRYWLDFQPALPPASTAALMKALAPIKPAQVRQGPVVFAFSVGLWGAAAPTQPMPSPLAWKKAVDRAGRPLEVGELVEMIWNE